MNKCKLILVGGFLGAGKTSLLWRAAETLKRQGTEVGLITNDQASNLVDTVFLADNGNLVREVSGSCFCCNFQGFSDAIAAVSERNGGGVVIAEPVGSCTDLSATLMQPLKDRFAEDVDLAPLTVLAAPDRLKEMLRDPGAFGSYIAVKQLEEADVILINKTDLLSAGELEALVNRTGERWPQARIMTASVKDGVGVEEWLELVRSAHGAGSHLAEVDYDVYAAGEAAYGWLNARFRLEGPGCYAAHEAAAKVFLTALSSAFDGRGATVGHVKFLLETPERKWVGNLTGKAHTAALRDFRPSGDAAALTVNARVELPPEELQEIVLAAVEQCFGAFGCVREALNCLIPGRPNPSYRYQSVV